MAMSHNNPFNPSNHTVLLVEDSPTQGRGLKGALERAGFSVVWFRDGEEALKWISQADTLPSIVISDVVMPRMDGFELTRRIKSGERTKLIPVIMLTALSDPLEVINGLKAGADNFLIKPSSSEQILRQVFYLLTPQSILSDPEDSNARVVLEISFGGQTHQITAHKMQIVNLIFSLIDSSSETAQKLDELLYRQEQLEEDKRILSCNLRQLLETMEDGIIVLDGGNNTLYRNASAMAIMETLGTEDLSSLPVLDIPDRGEVSLPLSGGANMVLEVRTSPILWDGNNCRMMILRDITELVTLRDQLRKQAVTDSLTGLYNRRGFIELSQSALKHAKLSKSSRSLIFMDLDGFKRLNDTMGHDAGNVALVEMAQAMTRSFRESDILGRVGGDEFACFIVHQHDFDPLQLIKRLEQHIISHGSYPLSVSYGVSHDGPDGVKSIEVMMTEADQAMYEQKRSKK